MTLNDPFWDLAEAVGLARELGRRRDRLRQPEGIAQRDHGLAQHQVVARGELNGRESLIWADSKISVSGYIDDGRVLTRINNTAAGPDLGTDYVWSGVPTAGGGSVSFKGGSAIALTRTISSSTQPATWRKP